MRTATRIVVALAALLGQGAALGQASFNVGVSAFIANGCTISATAVNFGTYAGTASSPPIDGLGQITVRCPLGNAYNVRLDNGVSAVGGQRRMAPAAGTARLNYELYRDAARSLRWGNNASERVSGTGTGAAQTLPVFARLPGAQVVAFGPYADTITATIQY